MSLHVQGNPGQSAYSSSKAATIGLAQAVGECSTYRRDIYYYSGAMFRILRSMLNSACLVSLAITVAVGAVVVSTDDLKFKLKY